MNIIAHKGTMYIVALVGVEWSFPQEIWNDRVDAVNRCVVLQKTLDERKMSRKNFIERHSTYEIVPVTHKEYIK